MHLITHYLLDPARGILAAILYSLNLIFIPILTILLGFLLWLIPLAAWQRIGNRWLQKLPVGWMIVNGWIMQISTYKRWDIQGPELEPNTWYILISNHRSWADILVLGFVFSKKIPLLKFFLKKELLWSLPIAGLACKAVGFPFMERHSREDLRKKPELRNADIESAKKACIKFKEHPCTVMNFVEGTRFSPLKKERQASPYQHLLKPKSGGVAVVLNEMHDSLKGIVNVTIGYSNPEFSFWDFVCGRVDKIVVRYQLLPVTADLVGDFYNDRNYRSNLQSWLNQLWEEKDQQLDKLQQQHTIS